MKWTIPNILTLLRLLAAPAIPVVFLYFSHPWSDWFALAIFVVAALTDFVDGYLARLWKQETAFGKMMDPIADKAMVMMALMVLVSFYPFQPLIIIPTTLIIFREVFVSGLREFLGDSAGLLQVTPLAKLKTTVQMVAIATLFSQGLFTHYFTVHSYGMSPEIVTAVLNGQEDDYLGLKWKHQGMFASYYGGLVLLWIAGLLTAFTGFDYLFKAMPYLGEREKK
jgi:cardiolipin synthase